MASSRRRHDPPRRGVGQSIVSSRRRHDTPRRGSGSRLYHLARHENKKRKLDRQLLFFHSWRACRVARRHGDSQKNNLFFPMSHRVDRGHDVNRVENKKLKLWDNFYFIFIAIKYLSRDKTFYKIKFMKNKLFFMKCCVSATRNRRNLSRLGQNRRDWHLRTSDSMQTPQNCTPIMKFTIPRLIPCKFHEIGVVFGVFPLISTVRGLKNIKIWDIFSTGLDRNTRKVTRFWRSNVRNSFSAFRGLKRSISGRKLVFREKNLTFLKSELPTYAVALSENAGAVFRSPE